MNSFVKITLTGANIPDFVPIGASITYGINRIPTATVHLDPSALSLLCNFESLRRQPALLTITTQDQCLKFDGVIDGHSISQQPGGLSTALILKSKFIFLNEVYPRLLGFNAGSQNIFTLNKTCKVFAQSFYTSDPSKITSSPTLLAAVQQLFGYEDVGLNYNSNIIDFIVGLSKAVVQSQQASGRVIPFGPWNERGSSLQKAIAAGDVNGIALGPLVLALLDAFDTSYCNKMALFANNANIAEHILNNMSSMQDTVFQNIVKFASEYGACVVVGNETAYIVPEAAYLNVPKQQTLFRGATSNVYNMAFPSEYENFTFSDAGENTIKGVYLIEDPDGHANEPLSNTVVFDGCYVDPGPNVFGNVVVRSLPNYAQAANVFVAGAGGIGIHNRITNGSKLVSAQVTYDDYQQAYNNVSAAISSAAYVPVRAFLDQLAEVEYCKTKFDDRGGSINMYFNNNFAPGCVGSLYTRQPGMYIDFFITSVSHNFSLSAPGQGSATTSVSFRGGRMGGSTGLDTMSMYDYTYADTQSFSNSFITDTST